MASAHSLRESYEAQVLPLVPRYQERYVFHRGLGIRKADMKAREDVLEDVVTMKEVLVPRSNGPESRAFPVNYDFENRAIMEIVGMHGDLQCGVSTHAGIATAMVSGDGYTNRDLGGYAESFMGTDISILAAPGKKEDTDQKWSDTRIAPLVEAQAAGSLLRLFRKHDGHFYRYCGLYRIADRWRSQVQFNDPDNPIPPGRKICFVKLQRMPGQSAVDPVELNPKNDRRKRQLKETILTLKGDSRPGNPDFCANCYLDGDGCPYIECEGCENRLLIETQRPQSCVGHRCWQRPVKCIHTVPSLICPECIDEGDKNEARRADSSWCCCLCAEFYNLWGNRTRTNRGMFLKTTQMNLAISRRPAPNASLPSAVSDRTPFLTTDCPSSKKQKKASVKVEENGDKGDVDGEAGPSNYIRPAKKTKSKRQQRRGRLNKSKGERGANNRNQEETEEGLQTASLRVDGTETLSQNANDDLYDTEKVVQQQQQQQQPPRDVMVDLVSDALLSHPDLDRGLIGEYLARFTTLTRENRQGVGQAILILARDPSVLGVKRFIESVVARP